MPRTGKGGKREGSSQTAYSNRTDLNNRGPQPITTVPGQTYGQAAMQEDAQRAVPMAGTPQPPAAAPTAAASEPAPPPGPGPGEIPWLHPSERPDEPVTAGLQSGPGPGPEALSGSPGGQAKLSDILGQAAAHPAASSQVQYLAAVAKQLNL